MNDRGVACCKRCGRKLEDPESVKLGIGPVCRDKPTKSKATNLDDFVSKKNKNNE